MNVYVDGLERSGNVFLAGAVSYTLGINVIAIRDHSINIFKNKDADSIFIVPLRDALPSIASGRVYKKYAFENNLNRSAKGIYDITPLVLKRYKEYTDYLLDNENLFIAPFHEFTKDHNAVIDVIGQTYGLNPIYRLTEKEIIEKIKIAEHPEVDNVYMSNFPRQQAPNRQKVEDLLLFYHKQELDEIQENINQLYKRYYDKVNHEHIG